jgi:hypothetical protein
MDTIDNERLIPLSEASTLPDMPRRRGKPITYETLRNWTTQGVRGITLEYRMVGTTPCTSEGALKRFFYRLSQPKPNPTATLPKERQASRERAAAVLDAAGI